jgi:hypothetical protein
MFFHVIPIFHPFPKDQLPGKTTLPKPQKTRLQRLDHGHQMPVLGPRCFSGFFGP